MSLLLSIGDLAAQQAGIAGELSTVDTALAILADMEREQTLTAHFDVLSEDCYCYFCRDWRELRDQLNILQRGLHTACKCEGCKRYYKLDYSFRTVAIKRDLWTELSFHVCHNRRLKPFAREVMLFLLNDIRYNDEFPPNFWTNHAVELPLYYWFQRIARKLNIPLIYFTLS